ncbi:MAG: hypothetical protein JOZ80_04015, partial [Acidobacteriaceae bacterium]|nr:hypothetical protein [Acidobacteriaceae bacterium]
MKSNSPTLEGFRLMLRQPALGVAEIAWRWSFAAVFWLALGFWVAEYLKSLPISSSELLLLKTRQPVLVWEAIVRIFHGSAWRAVESVIVLTIALATAWIVLNSVGRAAIIKSLIAHFRGEALSSTSERPIPLHSLLGLSFFRAAVPVAAVIGFAGAFFFASAV